MDKRFLNICSPELRLLFRCVQQSRAAQNLKDGLIQETIDWQYVLTLVRYHQSGSLVYKTLSQVPELVPQEILKALHREYKENMARSLVMTGELVKICAVLERQGIAYAVLKGIPLGYMLYGDLGYRVSGDLDILVWPEELDKAVSLLEGMEFRREDPSFLTERGRKGWLAETNHFTLHHKNGIAVELHWRLENNELSLPLAYVQGSLTNVMVAGHKISVMNKEELLLFLVLHGAKHGWARVKWLTDIAAMIQCGGFDWKRVNRLAQCLEVRCVLNQALLLAGELLKVPLGEEFMAVAAQDKKARQLALAAMPIIATPVFNKNCVPYKLRYFAYKQYKFYLLRGWKRKISYIGNQFRPTENDIRVITLPQCLYFLYYAIRPLAGVRRWLIELTGR
ncbi:MAG: hypothetical protein H6Q75_1072 [Firmicutes bacterium]|nr:hypothetical protein [Bacillota bacterium]